MSHGDTFLLPKHINTKKVEGEICTDLFSLKNKKYIKIINRMWRSKSSDIIGCLYCTAVIPSEVSMVTS